MEIKTKKILAGAIGMEENLSESVNKVMMDVRQSLMDKGYEEEQATWAIAGAMPACIAMAIIQWHEGKE